MSEAKMSHAMLVQLAARWLLSTRKCAVVATERNAASAFEAPDAIGWTPRGLSVLVECKTSRADFFADLKKPSRCGADAMGRERWYLTEANLLNGCELPPGWGWLALKNGRIHRVVHSTPSEDVSTLRAEIPLLVAITRRVSHEGNARGLTLLAPAPDLEPGVAL